MHKLSLIFSLLLLSFFCVSQDNVQLSKDSLSKDINIDSQKSLLLSIVKYYAQRGQVNKDSMKKYNIRLMNLFKDDLPSELKAKSKEYRLIANFRAPFVQYAEMAKDLISDYEALENYEGVAQEQYYLANKAHTAGRTESFSLYQEGIDKLEQYKGQMKTTSYCHLSARYLSSIAANYAYIGLYDDAIEKVTEAVTKAETCRDSLSMLYAYIPAGAILGQAMENVNLNHEKWPDLEEHLILYLRNTYAFAIALGKDVSAALAAYNLAHYFYSRNDLDQAEKFLMESWGIEGMEWMTRQVYLNHGIEADILYKRGRKKASLVAMKKSRASALELNEPLALFESQIEMSKWYLKENQIEAAAGELKKLDTMLLGNLEKRRNYYKLRYEIALKNNDDKIAVSALEQYHTYKDSINNSATSQQIASILSKYNMTIAENKIVMLESENAKEKLYFQKKIGIGISLLGIVTVGFLAFYFLAKQRLFRSKQEKQEVQEQLFRAQMNPHFIFNTLGSIQSFLLNKGKAQDAAYFLTKFAKLMRQILAQSQKTYISLQDEVDTLNHYLLLQRMRFEERFDFEIDIDPDIDLQGTQVPPMILQPVIENAIEHGKIYNQANGIVKVGIEILKDTLSITIVDNGLGKEHKENVPLIKKTDSFSLAIIKKRLYFVSQHFKQMASMNISQPVSGGTIVHILLPRITKTSM